VLRDDSGNGGGRPSALLNVLGDRLDVCSMTPKTGFSFVTVAATPGQKTSGATPSAPS
jgi:hypothetical protein